MDARLCIVQTPGTTLNVAMAANAPTIGVWRRDHYPYSAQAKGFFRDLEKCKIIFYDSREAANHVNDVWDNIDDWWNNSDVQSARRMWCDQFALTSRYWWLDWAKALFDLSKEHQVRHSSQTKL